MASEASPWSSALEVEEASSVQRKCFKDLTNVRREVAEADGIHGNDAELELKDLHPICLVSVPAVPQRTTRGTKVSLALCPRVCIMCSPVHVQAHRPSGLVGSATVPVASRCTLAL